MKHIAIDEEIINCLNDRYIYQDGLLLYKAAPKGNPSLIGKIAGTLHNKGYRSVKIDSRQYLQHRLIWAMHNGPIDDKDIIDHKDGNRLNNRISNLRRTSLTHNRANCHSRRNKKDSPYKGVYKNGCKWRAVVRFNKAPLYLGQYNTEIEAALIVDAKLRELHGIKATLNFPLSGERSAHTGEII